MDGLNLVCGVVVAGRTVRLNRDNGKTRTQDLQSTEESQSAKYYRQAS